MVSQRPSKAMYGDLQCYALEQIERGEELDRECQEIIPELIKDEFLSEDGHLTDVGRRHLSQAIGSARDENRSALTYAGIITGFTITFFGLVLPVFVDNPIYPLLFAYLIILLFFSIAVSFLAAFCFWHGCSLEHRWRDLRIFNETGDSTIIFNGWIILYTLYVVLFLSLARLDISSQIPFLEGSLFSKINHGSLLYFLAPSITMLALIVFSYEASKRSEVRTAQREWALRDVITDFIVVSAFIASGGERFFRPKNIPRRGWFILITLAVAFFSAIPIVLLAL